MMRFFFIFSLFVCAASLNASYTLKNGKLINSEIVATLSVQEHYSALLDAYQRQEWEEVIHQSLIVTKNFAGTPFAEDAYFYLGVGYFQLNEFELANSNLTKYLKKQTSPKFF